MDAQDFNRLQREAETFYIVPRLIRTRDHRLFDVHRLASGSDSFLLVGAPGSGKTETLKHIQHVSAKEYPRSSVAIYLDVPRRRADVSLSQEIAYLIHQSPLSFGSRNRAV